MAVIECTELGSTLYCNPRYVLTCAQMISDLILVEC